MPKRQKVLETAADAVSVPEPKKKKAADKSTTVAKTPAATHKRAASKTKKDTSALLADGTSRNIQQAALDAAVLSHAATEVQLSSVSVDSNTAVPAHEQIAVRAYYHFLARGSQHGFDVEDWCRAERELLELA